MSVQSRSLLVGATGQIGRQMLGRMQQRALPTTRAVEQKQDWLHLDLATIAHPDDAERALA